MKSVLLVDDDEDLREALAETLSFSEEYEVFQAENANQGLALVRNNRLDIAILDVGLPDIDGRELCKLIRKEGYNFPIVMLTGHSGEANEILGLDSGANDYLTKPFSASVIMARLRVQFRQFEKTEDVSFAVGDATFQPSRKIFVSASGERIRLTEKEVGILRYLCRHPERRADRATLLAQVWGYGDGISTHTLETHIYRLRKKIEPPMSGQSYLTTERGEYKLA